MAKKVKEKPVGQSRQPYVHIDTFLETARVLYEMNEMQVQGFKSFMSGKHYQKGDEAFIPPLKKYLGKGD